MVRDSSLSLRKEETVNTQLSLKLTTFDRNFEAIKARSLGDTVIRHSLTKRPRVMKETVFDTDRFHYEVDRKNILCCNIR